MILSGCTQFERFNTDKILTDTTGINTANIKLTTNIKNVFIIPKASCISISDNVLSMNNEKPERTTDGWTLLKGWREAPFEENQKKNIGMKSISLEELSSKYNVKFSSKTYLSKEYRLEAGIPYVVFIKTEGEFAGLLFNSAEDEYGFGVSFILTAGKDYQLLLQSEQNTTTNWTSATTANSKTSYLYNYKLLDITNGVVNSTDRARSIRAYGCK